MTSSNPPYPYFNGITYNPSFFSSSSSSSSGSGLTKAQANALYLQKTVADTATGLETFSGGIATNSLNTTTTASNLLIGATGNTGTITISTINTGNTNANPAISIGTDAGTKTIKINNNTNSVHCSSIDLQNYSINNIVNTTGDISIGDKQTAGVINVGTKVDRTGNINIGTGATGPCNINIGSTGSTGLISLSKPITINYATPTATNQIGYVSGGVFSATALGSSDYAFPKSFQLPIGTYILTFNAQISYTSGSFVNAYSGPYSGATSGALTTLLTPYYFGFNNLMTGTGTKFIGIGGNMVLTITSANLWYTYGLTYTGTAVVNDIQGSFTTVRIA